MDKVIPVFDSQARARWLAFDLHRKSNKTEECYKGQTELFLQAAGRKVGKHKSYSRQEGSTETHLDAKLTGGTSLTWNQARHRQWSAEQHASLMRSNSSCCNTPAVVYFPDWVDSFLVRIIMVWQLSLNTFHHYIINSVVPQHSFRDITSRHPIVGRYLWYFSEFWFQNRT